MKIFKYNKIIAFFCVLILLFVFFAFPASAVVSFSPGDNQNVFNTPGRFIINYNCTPVYGSSYYASYSVSPVVSVYPDAPVIYTRLVDDYTTALDIHEVDPYLRLTVNSLPHINSHTDLTIDENNNLSGLAAFDYYVTVNDFPTEYAAPPFISSFQFVDFYCWNHDDVQEFHSEIVFYIPEFNREVISIDIVYRPVGEVDYTTVSLDPSGFSNFRFGNFEIAPEDIDGNGRSDAVYYVKSLIIKYADPPSDYTVESHANVDGILSFCYYPGLLEYDISEHEGQPEGNPAFALAPYTTWLANAVSGFMDFELYKGFSLGGIFMTIIAFACCVWFIKLVAGG